MFTARIRTTSPSAGSFSARKCRLTLSDEAEAGFEAKRRELIFERTEANNRRLTLDTMKEKAEIRELSKQIGICDEKLRALEAQKKRTIRENVRRTRGDSAFNADYRARHAALKARYAAECAAEISDEMRGRSKLLAKEIYLSVSRYPAHRQGGLLRKLMGSFKKAMRLGADLSDGALLDAIFETAVFHASLKQTLRTSGDQFPFFCQLPVDNIPVWGILYMCRRRVCREGPIG